MKRSERVKIALVSAGYIESELFSMEESVCYLLTDLRHFCKNNDVDIDSRWEMSLIHFNEELDGDQEEWE